MPKKGEAQVIDRTGEQLTGPMLGLATTRQLLEELRARGDVNMVVSPGTEAAVDGYSLSAFAGALLRLSSKETLDYRTVDH